MWQLPPRAKWTLRHDYICSTVLAPRSDGQPSSTLPGPRPATRLHSKVLGLPGSPRQASQHSTHTPSPLALRPWRSDPERVPPSGNGAFCHFWMELCAVGANRRKRRPLRREEKRAIVGAASRPRMWPSRPFLGGGGGASEEGGRGMSIWQRRGPWAVCGYAAAIYARSYSALPAHLGCPNFADEDSACSMYEQKVSPP